MNKLIAVIGDTFSTRGQAVMLTIGLEAFLLGAKSSLPLIITPLPLSVMVGVWLCIFEQANGFSIK